ncbi:enhancer of split M1 protein-like [Aedes albopictus]|uniref:Kazal-like domain-containing protein n=1 Tax=Aedes albopictus TaxID=7160 RepID=A0ABM1YJ41_AEDAL
MCLAFEPFSASRKSAEMNSYSVFLLLVITLAAVTLQLSSAEGNCPMPCPHIMDPVCSTDGAQIRRFSNRCLMQAYNECESENGKTYQEVDAAHCGDDDDNWI